MRTRKVPLSTVLCTRITLFRGLKSFFLLFFFAAPSLSLSIMCQTASLKFLYGEYIFGLRTFRLLSPRLRARVCTLYPRITLVEIYLHFGIYGLRIINELLTHHFTSVERKITGFQFIHRILHVEIRAVQSFSYTYTLRRY